MNVANLKRKHRFIFCTEISGRLIYWRPLTLREHDIYIKILNLGLSPEGKVHDLIFRDIVLDPGVIDAMYQTPAGLVPSIACTALAISGNELGSTAEMDQMNIDIAEMREAISANPIEQFFILICKAFPTYTPSDLEHLEYQELLRLVIMAEQMVGLEEPVKLKYGEQKKGLTDQIFEDKKRAEQVDRGTPNRMDPTYDMDKILRAKESQKDLSMRQARQIEMAERIRRRAG